MVVHGRAMHIVRQQNSDPLAAPSSLQGFTGAITNSPAATVSESLAVDRGASSVFFTPPPLIPSSSTLVITNTPSPTPTPSSTLEGVTPSSTPTAVGATSTKPIALSTVIGSCVGAFIGASALIILGIWMYRRYNKQLKQRSRRGPSRNAQGNEQRRRSRLEPWNKLNDDDDKWEDMYQTKEAKEIDQVAPMEKLTMFKKTPSVRTAYTHKSTDVTAFHFPQSYGEFDPKLVQTLTTGQTLPEAQSVKEVKPETPWETGSLGNGSFLTIRTQVSGGGAMSPTLQMAIPTPPPTISQTHKWESAEVVHYSDAEDETQKNVHNPFFNAQDYAQPRSRSNSVAKSAKAKGKERMRYSNVSTTSNPFEDTDNTMPMPPKPVFVHHSATASTASTESKERALQSLVAALDLSEDEVRERLRVASMQPSIISQVSSVGGEEEDVTKAFPLPPSRDAGLGSN